ncbi:MAG: 16S rRNA (cytosine(1402)-N(4))-methyltransferase, partial [Phenylobacterium sp. RIFCSPHIGHO2_01_FULL_70_10]
FLTERAGRTPAASRHLPPSVDSRDPSFELLFNGARSPGEAEVEANPRARSAKLRAAVRTHAPVWSQAA